MRRELCLLQACHQICLQLDRHSLAMNHPSSIVQAIYHGKPIVGMPFFGDQPTNADRVVAKVISPFLTTPDYHTQR